MTVEDMEIALAGKIGYRKNMIVPNVSWGMGFDHELDLAVVTKNGYLYEIEIKTNMSDLKQDKRKKRGHVDAKGNRIKRLYFAIPESIDKNLALLEIPTDAGLFTVDEYGRVKKVREAKDRPGADKLTEEEYRHITHLLSMRVWSMKSKMRALIGSIRLQQKRGK